MTDRGTLLHQAGGNRGRTTMTPADKLGALGFVYAILAMGYRGTPGGRDSNKDSWLYQAQKARDMVCAWTDYYAGWVAAQPRYRIPDHVCTCGGPGCTTLEQARKRYQ